MWKAFGRVHEYRSELHLFVLVVGIPYLGEGLIDVHKLPETDLA